MIRQFKKIRRFARRTEISLLDSLHGQLQQTSEGVELAILAVRGEIDRREARLQMSEIEHLGDRERGNFVSMLKRSLSIPLDREDMFRVSRAIDDILDNLRDFVREFDVYDMDPQPDMTELLEAIGEGVKNLDKAVFTLMSEPRRIRKAALLAKKNNVRHLYQDALALVLSSGITEENLKKRELLRRLDLVAVALADAANTLADGAVKRSH